MSGPQPKYPIKLTTEEETKLDCLIKARNSRQGEVVRAKIILTAHRQPAWNNQQIAKYKIAQVRSELIRVHLRHHTGSFIR